jgi:hypothetical protein
VFLVRRTVVCDVETLSTSHNRNMPQSDVAASPIPGESGLRALGLPLPEHSETDAILFLPGMGQQSGSDEAALVFASRLAASLDHSANTAAAVFRVKSRVDEIHDGGEERKVLVSQIVRVEPAGTERCLLDVYKVDFNDILTGAYEQQSTLARTLVTALEALKGALRIGGALLRGKGVGARQLLTVLMAFAMWLLVLFYFLLLLASLGAAVAQAWQPSASSSTGHFQRALSDFVKGHPGIGNAATGVVLLATAITSIMPAKVKAELAETAASYVRMCAYLSINHQRSAILGRFHAALEHIAEKKPRYQRIHIFANSFGSVVALDAMFPPKSHPKARFPRLAAVDKLVTIGCPFDFIRALWPLYFRDRVDAADAPKYWLNVYAPPDAFGSNFRDDDLNQEATTKLGSKSPENLVYERCDYGLIESLTFIALRAHGIYWNLDADHKDQGCLRDVVSVAFGGESILD